MQKPQPNPKQLECIENIDGKFLVLAGPGTGKTFTVIQRIKNILSKNVPADKILCLAFSQTAANEMKDRLDKEIGKINNINIYTYHGFCFNLIEQYSEYFDLSENIRIITESTSRALIKECIDEIKPIYLKNSKNDPYAYIKKIKDRISEIKQNRLTKEEFEYNLKYNQDWLPQIDKIDALIKEKHAKGETRTKGLEEAKEEIELAINQLRELWIFYDLYQEKMSKYHLLDFNDMINLVLEKFKSSPSFLEKIAKQYEYILVDEYQDTNKSQNDIVFNLSSACKNIFVVGDDDQIIYSFQGAKLDTIEKYLSNFPETKVICLNENMRSTQNILDISRAIVLQDSNRLEANPKFEKFGIDKNLIAKNKELYDKNYSVKLNKYHNILDEYCGIISKIEEIISSKDCPTDKDGNKDLAQIAILTRSNAELDTFSQMLKERGIPSELKEGKNIFTINSSLVLFYYLKALCSPDLYSDKLIKLLLNQPFNINPKDFELIHSTKTNHKSIIEAIKEINKFIEQDKIDNFIKTFEYLKEYKNNENIKNIILEVGSKTGIFNYYLNCETNKHENIAGIKKFIDEATAFMEINKTVLLEDFIEYLEISIVDEIEIKTDKAPKALNAIQLSTYFSAKGREFDYVFMPTLTARKWEKGKANRPNIPLHPDEYKDEEQIQKEKISDRIKVLYVGMTRARHSLFLSYSIDKTVSDFIKNIQDNLEIKEAQEQTIEEFWETIKKGIVKKEYDYKKEFKDFIDAMLNDRAFSASAINCYLSCPRKYLYERILELGAKDSNPNSLSYGSAVHKACENAIKYAIENKQYPSCEYFIEEFKAALKKLPMSSYEQKEIHLERGEKALKEYYNQLILTPIDWLCEVEKEFNIEIEGIKFVGYIDRIDILNDEIMLYDYKTGKAKSKSSIAPEKNHEDYYNQMAFYKYAIEKIENKKVKSTTFIFAEEFKKNVELDFSEEEIQAVVQKFVKASRDIQAHNFEKPENQSAENCKFCQYKDFCNMEII
ncbi:MAG: ATP-dependent helicase [Candidatus Gastranaerophilales bacterium]|nr:ATP-dependent helicase [Candidatus Gastranaerophilales bacterium]